MKDIIRYITIVFLILFAAAGLVLLFQSPFEDADRMTLPELVKKINANEVKEIAVKGDDLNIILANDKIAMSRKEPGVSAFETLLNLGATPEKLSTTKVSIENAEGGAGAIFVALLS